jgi:broad specificity phosphatase PhoE
LTTARPARLNGRLPHALNGTVEDGGCRIYMVRHGQTVWNVERRFRGTIEVPLNEKGRMDAQHAAQALGVVGLSAVYTSPLSRAREVAEAIASAAGLSRPVDDAGLLNIDYGVWHGLTKEECAERDPIAWRLYKESPEEAACPEGEALAHAADRVTAALFGIAARHRVAAVAAVSHGAMVRLALLRAGYCTGPEWEVPLDTGSATVLDVRDHTNSVVGVAEKEPAERGTGALVLGSTPVAAAHSQ